MKSPPHTAGTVLIADNSSRNLTNFRKPIIRAIKKRGLKVIAAVPYNSETGMLEELGIEVRRVRMNPRGISPISDARLLAQYRRIIDDVAPSAVLAFTAKPNIYASVAARSRGVPVINTITGLGTGFLSGSVLQAVMKCLYKIALRGSEMVFFHNSDDRDLFVRANLVSPKNAAVVPGSGVDLRRFKPVQAEAPNRLNTFLFIGRLLMDKGAVEFAEAARIVRARREANFQILGPMDAHPKAVSPDCIEQWRAEGLIQLLGNAADVRPFIAAADCIVLPSYREGFPRVLLEASAMAKPIIASDVPGCRQAVQDAITGFLCEVRSAHSLAEAILRFLDLPSDAVSAMGRAGRIKAEREFSDEIVSGAYVDELCKLKSRVMI